MMNHNLSPFSGSPDSAKIEHQSPYINTNNLMAIPPTSAPAPIKTKAKPRKRVNTAEKRHQHNAVERQRRETLNSKFIVLARLLPALANHRRPSKSAIVNGSISHMTKQRDQRLLAATLLRQLCAERDTLAKECNEWRAASGFHSKEVAKKAWTEEMEEVCMVENETFGEFANMGEEGDDDQDQEGQDSQESYEMGMSMDIGQATAAVASFNNTGLITTRSSTDIDPLSLALGISSSVPTQTRPATTQTAPVLTHSQSMPVNWHSTFPFASAINMNSNVNMNNLSPDPIAVNSLNGTGILPFNAFMTDSLDSLSSSPSGSMHNMPTPPTSNDFSRFTHTPSPRSSGSYEDGSKAMPIPQLHSTTQRQSQAQQPQWTAQQLLFLHSVQQQQLQEAHIAEMQSRGMPVSTAAASAAAGNSFPARSASSMSVGNDLPENFVHQLQTARASLPLYPHSAFPPPQHLQQLQQQQQQQQQQQFQQQLLQQQQQQQQQLPGLQGMPRMSLEQLEAWRNVTGSNNAGLGMGLWTQSQGQNATVKGF